VDDAAELRVFVDLLAGCQVLVRAWRRGVFDPAEGTFLRIDLIRQKR
jgi:hypothetical protein